MKATGIRKFALCAAAGAIALTLAAAAQAQQTSTETPPAAASEPATPPADAATQPASATTPQTAPAPATEVARGIMSPPEGKGQIIFFRQRRFVGSALSFSVREGDTGIGRLDNGTYFVHVTDPGIHEYNIQSEATDALRLEVEAGETYFVLEQIKMGVMVGRPTLSPSDRAMFESKPLELSTRPGVDRRRDDD